MVKKQNKIISGWGRNNMVNCKVLYPNSVDDIANLRKEKTIARGLGRSYGDSAIQPNSTLDMTALNKIEKFSEDTGILSAQAGISIDKILKTFLPLGWMLPVTPGSKFITLGGMIASDVHGKNHHIDGSIANFVEEISVIIDKEVVNCSINNNNKLFLDTIGGMGLTGVIIQAKIKLLKVTTSYIKQETIPTINLQETMEVFRKNLNSKYIVAWIDCFAKGKNFGRSIIYKGEHAELDDIHSAGIKNPIKIEKKSKLKLLFPFPNFILNNFSIKLFNKYFFLKNRFNKNKVLSYHDYFYPLDFLNNWNLMYGKKGFVQYQFVLPEKNSFHGLTDVLKTIKQYNLPPFLTVLKLMGKKSIGTMSFPMPGYTLALDFPIRKGTYELLDALDKIIIKNNGRIYLAKDNRVSKEKFHQMFENEIKSFNSSNNYRSLQSERVEI